MSHGALNSDGCASHVGAREWYGWIRGPLARVRDTGMVQQVARVEATDAFPDTVARYQFHGCIIAYGSLYPHGCVPRVGAFCDFVSRSSDTDAFLEQGCCILKMQRVLVLWHRKLWTG